VTNGNQLPPAAQKLKDLRERQAEELETAILAMVDEAIKLRNQARPRSRPASKVDEFTWPLEFDWDAFRLVLGSRLGGKEGVKNKGRRMGFTNVDAFLRGDRPTVTVDSLVRMMWFLEIFDIREFLKEK